MALLAWLRKVLLNENDGFASYRDRIVMPAWLVEGSMTGASGRLYLAGTTAPLRKAQARVDRLLEEIEGR